MSTNIQENIRELQQLLQEGNYQRVISTSQNLLKNNKNDTNILNALGSALLAKGEMKEGISVLEEAIAIAPDNFLLHFNIGNGYRNLKENDKAINAYQKSIQLNKDFVQSYNNLGNIYLELRQYEEALKYLKMGFEKNPKYYNIITNIAAVFIATNNLKELLDFIINVFNHNKDNQKILFSITNYLNLLSFKDAKDEIIPVITSLITNKNLDGRQQVVNSQIILNNRFLDHIQNDPVVVFDEELSTKRDMYFDHLIAHLKNLPLHNVVFEKFINNLRKVFLDKILNNLDNFILTNRLYTLLQAIACLEHNSNFVMYQSKDEKDKLEIVLKKIISLISKEDIKSLTLINLVTLYACYSPLRDNKDISQWIESNKNEDEKIHFMFSNFIDNFKRENKYYKKIKTLSSLENLISKKVSTVYENNPYPRWNAININDQAVPFIQVLFNELPVLDKKYINPIQDMLKKEKLNILVAGCGTGRDALVVAKNILNSKVTAIDLSKSSLAYASMMANKYDVNNINFLQADILEVEKIGQKYDFIICGGVLHHMENPEAGLRSLLKVLHKNSPMKIGLYSKKAREHIINIKENHISHKDIITDDYIRDFRQKFMDSNDKDFIEIRRSSDYFSLNEVRDLIFHIQEHQFTAKRLKDLLLNNDLEFMGFKIRRPDIISEYIKTYPSDPNAINLDLWDEFENNKYPRLFAEMYNFWCYKK